MRDEVDQLYFEWLVDQVGSGEGFVPLLKLLHDKEFIFIIPNDENRREDALDLRVEFLRVDQHEPDSVIPTGTRLLHPYCSLLELLVALSRKLEFMTDEPALGWAMALLENLELHRMRGDLDPVQVQYVDEILERLVWRNFQADGLGGFFPLSWPEEDQRQVELWYQMSAYVDEKTEL
jgi:hypothetical protein